MSVKMFCAKHAPYYLLCTSNPLARFLSTLIQAPYKRWRRSQLSGYWFFHCVSTTTSTFFPRFTLNTPQFNLPRNLMMALSNKTDTSYILTQVGTWTSNTELSTPPTTSNHPDDIILKSHQTIAITALLAELTLRAGNQAATEIPRQKALSRPYQSFSPDPVRDSDAKLGENWSTKATYADAEGLDDLSVDTGDGKKA
jgi:hypothetical protein